MIIACWCFERSIYGTTRIMQSAGVRTLHWHASRHTALLKCVIGKENDPSSFTPLQVAQAHTNVKEENEGRKDDTWFSWVTQKTIQVLNFKVSLYTGRTWQNLFDIQTCIRQNKESGQFLASLYCHNIASYYVFFPPHHHATWLPSWQLSTHILKKKQAQTETKMFG